MTAFLDKVRQTVEEHGLFDRGDRVIVAVSGGPDSTALLLALAALSPEYNLHLTVAHLNHMFRGAEAETDARWVEELASRLDLPFVREDADVPALIRSTGLTVEQAGRVARYEFYERVARAVGATRVAVGQTLDDQAETVLLHLLRGAGLTGIAGIRPKRPAPYGYVVRPLLNVTRAETEAYCAAAGLTPRHDPYNDDLHYLRNRIRHRLLPWLAANINPRIKELLAQAAAIWQAEDDYLADCARTAYREVVRQEKEAVALAGERLAALPLALRRRVVRLAFAALSDEEARDLAFEHTQALLELAAGSGRALDLPHGVHAERVGAELVLTRPGTTLIPELGWAVHVIIEGKPAPYPSGSLVASADFDYNEAGHQLFARNWRAGDWFCPRGLKGRKKLSDFFIDAKVPRPKRGRTLIITAGDDIIWVVGMREDGRYVAGPGTTSKVRIEVRQTSLAQEGDAYEQH
ncbi:MAG: tRNA(Ile)-lysidine synthase [Bacillota bacterium]|nr:tRNA(Ile)-lysidine synthase [Bacillota bacterium]